MAEVVTPAGPEGFHYPLVEHQEYVYHRFDSLITVHPGGTTQLQTTGRTAWLGVSVRDTLVATPAADSLPDSLAVTADAGDSTRFSVVGLSYLVEFTLDSVSQDPRSSLRQPALDSVRGGAWSMLMTPSGGVGPIAVAWGSSIAESLSGELARLFFPTVPRDGAAPGSRWKDSTQTMIGGLSVAQTEQALTDYSVPDQDLKTTPGVLRINASSRIRRWGTGQQGGQDIELEGTGTDSITYYLGPAGSFLGTVGADSVALTFTIPAVGQSVPVYQVGHYSVRRLGEDIPAVVGDSTPAATTPPAAREGESP